ncbi:NADH-quinone oxidoreductase subunit NuoK [Halobacteriaceae archaeon SHR40]|uniref:NADH-quinone oxidoreductase subunit NuoK n=1 Tax=Halovenus amylolytica TaxID=2500550 RepID=UPI000FE2BFE6
MAVSIEWYLFLSAAIFSIGLFGILTQRNALMFLMSVELLLNAANINLVAFSLYWGNLTGQLFALIVIALAAAEVAIGIGIILTVNRNFDNIDVTEAATMRW